MKKGKSSLTMKIMKRMQGTVERKGAKDAKEKQMQIYHREHGGHGGKNLSQRMCAAQTHTFADSCITFMLFMFFIVKCISLCSQ